MSTRTSRPIPIGLTLLIAVFSALVALAFSGGHDAMAHNDTGHAATAATSPQELALRQDMRKLWEDHITWTRLAIISLTTDSPDTQATVGRLLRNQTDIGNAIAPFYGAAAGHQLTALLRQHILQAVVILGDVKANHQAALQRDIRAWYANADRVAAFLHAANPRHWTLDEMRHMMHTHLDLTTAEAVAELHGQFPASVAAYDHVEQEILRMADMLSTGIIAQFPGRFS